MATWLNRLQVQGIRNSGVTEDVAVFDTTWDFCTGTSQSSFAALGAVNNATSGQGAPAGSDYTNLLDNMAAFLTANVSQFGASLTWNFMTAHVINSGTPVPNPAVATRIISTVGSATNTLPPQAAASITLATNSRPHWGRFYLPSLSTTLNTSAGRIASSNQTTLVAAVKTLFDAMAADNWYPVVKTVGLNDAARTVSSIRMDNVWDVIRRRRYDRSTNTVITSL